MDTYRPAPGDRVKLSHWSDDRLWTVTYVGQTWFLADDPDGVEAAFRVDDRWVRVDAS